jgi:hypothetical protein
MWATNTTEDRPLPPLLAHLIEATRSAGESKHAAAIRELGHLAAAYVPGRDIVTGAVHVDTDSETHRRLREIATRHLGLAQLERRFRNALGRMEPEAQREAVATAIDDVFGVRDTAHVLWGLTIGLTLADHVSRGRR